MKYMHTGQYPIQLENGSQLNPGESFEMQRLSSYNRSFLETGVIVGIEEDELRELTEDSADPQDNPENSTNKEEVTEDAPTWS